MRRHHEPSRKKRTERWQRDQARLPERKCLEVELAGRQQLRRERAYLRGRVLFREMRASPRAWPRPQVERRVYPSRAVVRRTRPQKMLWPSLHHTNLLIPPLVLRSLAPFSFLFFHSFIFSFLFLHHLFSLLLFLFLPPWSLPSTYAFLPYSNELPLAPRRNSPSSVLAQPTANINLLGLMAQA